MTDASRLAYCARSLHGPRDRCTVHKQLLLLCTAEKERERDREMERADKAEALWHKAEEASYEADKEVIRLRERAERAEANLARCLASENDALKSRDAARADHRQAVGECVQAYGFVTDAKADAKKARAEADALRAENNHAIWLLYHRHGYSWDRINEEMKQGKAALAGTAKAEGRMDAAGQKPDTPSPEPAAARPAEICPECGLQTNFHRLDCMRHDRECTHCNKPAPAPPEARFKCDHEGCEGHDPVPEAAECRGATLDLHENGSLIVVDAHCPACPSRGRCDYEQFEKASAEALSALKGLPRSGSPIYGEGERPSRRGE